MTAIRSNKARRGGEQGFLTQAAVVVLGFAIIMVDGYDLQSIGFVAPEIARSEGYALTQFAPVFAAGLFGTIPGAMGAGPLARILGERTILALSLAVFGMASLGCAFAEDLNQLAALRFVVGIGVGAAVPLTMSIVAANTSARFRATLVTLTLCGQPFGAILGAALCAWLIPQYGWQSAFIVGGVAPFVLIAFVFLVPRLAHGATAQGRERVRDLFAPHLVATSLLLWAAAFLSVLLLYLIVNWLPGIVRGAGNSLEQSLLIISIFNAGGIVGALGIAALIDRFGVFKVAPAVFLIAAGFIASLSLTVHAFGALQVAALLSGVAGYGGGASIGAMAVLLYPATLRTTGAGWTLAIGRFGAAIGPFAAASALEAGLAPENLFYGAAVAALFASILMFVLAALGAGRAGTRA
jgi:AAHS family 4-hydroxybenzoate transporter-like MFS transporter